MQRTYSGRKQAFYCKKMDIKSAERRARRREGRPTPVQRGHGPARRRGRVRWEDGPAKVGVGGDWNSAERGCPRVESVRTTDDDHHSVFSPLPPFPLPPMHRLALRNSSRAAALAANNVRPFSTLFFRILYAFFSLLSSSPTAGPRRTRGCTHICHCEAWCSLFLFLLAVDGR